MFESLRVAGIGVNLHYIPVYRQPYYREFGYLMTDWPESEKYYEEAISLPIYPALMAGEQDKVIQILTETIA